jgi:hypothetical protein
LIYSFLGSICGDVITRLLISILRLFYILLLTITLGRHIMAERYT